MGGGVVLTGKAPIFCNKFWTDVHLVCVLCIAFRRCLTVLEYSEGAVRNKGSNKLVLDWNNI